VPGRAAQGLATQQVEESLVVQAAASAAVAVESPSEPERHLLGDLAARGEPVTLEGPSQTP
jgi:hypothetical protein